jgi:hypothetical protein
MIRKFNLLFYFKNNNKKILSKNIFLILKYSLNEFKEYLKEVYIIKQTMYLFFQFKFKCWNKSIISCLMEYWTSETVF